MAMNLVSKADDNALYRYEKKYLVNNIDLKTLTTLFKTNKLFFREVYQKRKVKNIYLDTVNFQHFKDHLNEEFTRYKIRIRWYDGKLEYSIPNLEIKKRHGVIGAKFVSKIDTPFDGNINKFIYDVIRESFFLKINSIYSDNLRATLYNEYDRRYFISSILPIRITVDYNLNYGKIYNNKVIMQNNYDSFLNKGVIEVKYDANLIASNEIDLPFYQARFSKYIEGITQLYSTNFLGAAGHR